MPWKRDESRKTWQWMEHGHPVAETSDEMISRAGYDGQLRFVAILSGFPPSFTTAELWRMLAVGREVTA